MKKPKMFFDINDSDGEFCHSLEYFKERISEGEAEFYKLVEAVPDMGQEYFFCSEFQAVGLKENSDCGKSCVSYEPRNKKSGRCKHSKHCYTEGKRQFMYYGKTLVEIKP